MSSRIIKHCLAIMLVSHASILEIAARTVPLNPGEVLMSNGGNSNWHWESGQGGKISGRVGAYGNNGTIDMNYYKKDGHGEFFFYNDNFNEKCADFDTCVFFFRNRGTPIDVQVTVFTDVGRESRQATDIGGNAYKSWTEMEVFLGGGKLIKNISIKVSFRKRGVAYSQITFLGLILRDTSEFNVYQKHLDRYAKINWSGLLRGGSYEPEFKPYYGVFVTKEELDENRRRYGETHGDEVTELFERAAPERAISDYAYSTHCTRAHTYKRLNELNDLPVHFIAKNAAVMSYASLMMKDKRLMRMAARYALTLASYHSWAENPLCQTVGGTFSAAFGASEKSFYLAIALDCAGEALTPQGHDYILKSLMQKGVSQINYSMWARDPIKSNQAAAFIKGKMAGLAIFNKVWPRVEPQIRIAKDELDECLDNVFSDDGGFMESTSYLNYSMKNAIPSYMLYSRIHDCSIQSVSPDNLLKSSDYADIISSTCENPGCVALSIGQNHSWSPISLNVLAFMAAALPESLWGNLYERRWRESGNGFSCGLGINGLWESELHKMAKRNGTGKPKPFVCLESCGLLSSTRETSCGDVVKLVMVGDASGVGKKHYDVGSVILEYAGDVFAMDMPVYYGVYTEAQYHNMLVPRLGDGMLGNPHNYSKIFEWTDERNAMRPSGNGDKECFSGRIEASNGWDDKFFRKWNRDVMSDNPNSFVIRDEYELGSEAKGVAFIWMTYLPLSVTGNIVVIHGERGGECEITAPKDCEIKIDEFYPGDNIFKSGMSLSKQNQCKRIMIMRDEMAGVKKILETKIRLSKDTKK